MLANHPLLPIILDQYRLHIDGIHGLRHWERVERLGLALAKQNGADQVVVRLFALFHDACRENDGDDRDHGPRAAAFVRRLGADTLALSERQLEVLAAACEGHTIGHLSDDVTIGTCWDADRLDLSRLDIVPDPQFLSTVEASDLEMIFLAYELSAAEREEYENATGY